MEKSQKEPPVRVPVPLRTKEQIFHQLVAQISVVTDWPYNKVVNAVGDILTNSICAGDQEQVSFIASLNYIFKYTR